MCVCVNVNMGCTAPNGGVNNSVAKLHNVMEVSAQYRLGVSHGLRLCFIDALRIRCYVLTHWAAIPLCCANWLSLYEIVKRHWSLVTIMSKPFASCGLPGLKE